MNAPEPIGDGGPAFPVQELNFDGSPASLTIGMSLCDYFAGQALAGWLATYGDAEHPIRTGYGERLAQDAYAMADDMLKVRAARMAAAKGGA